MNYLDYNHKTIKMKRVLLSLILITYSVCNIAQVSQKEFDALKSFYIATNGDSWIERTGWENINSTATKDDVTSNWVGLKIFDGHVDQIVMYSNNLTGELPAALEDLEFLEVLAVGGNRLSGPIPAFIGNMSKLVDLSLGGNNFTGPMPSGLGNLTKLYTLDLSYNELTGPIPESIENLSGMIYLSLNWNGFTGELPALTNMSGLRQIGLNYNSFTGSIPQSWGEITGLESINISDNQLSGPLPSNIGSTDSYFYLNIENNYFTFADIEPVQARCLLFDRYSYCPQYQLVVSTQSILINSSEQLGLNAQTLTDMNLGGNNNRYRWMKDGVEIQSGNNPAYVVSSVSPGNTGIYICEITNLIVEDLVLTISPLVVNVLDGSNNPPTSISLSNLTVEENALWGDTLGLFSASDINAGDSHIYTYTPGNGTDDRDNNFFTIDGDVLIVNNSVNFERKDTYRIRIKAEDNSGGICVNTFEINVKDVNEAPDLTGQSTSLDVTSANGTLVFELSASDPENDEVSYVLQSGNTNNAFLIDGDKLIVRDNSVFDYGLWPQYKLEIGASDGELTGVGEFIVNMMSVDLLPVFEDVTFTIDENPLAGSIVGTLVATDPEKKPLTFKLESDGSNIFKLDDNILKVEIPDSMDFDINPEFNLIVSVTDGVSTVLANVTIKLNNLSDENGNDIFQLSHPEICFLPQ